METTEKAYTTDCSRAAILGWTDTYRRIQTTHVHAQAHKYIYKHRIQKKERKTLKATQKKIFQYKISMYLNKLLLKI